MKQIYPDLWQTNPEHPFGPDMSTHAYLLISDAGNVLFYSSGQRDEYQHMLELGGIVRQYLSHRDEAGAALPVIKQIFGSLLCCHKLEEAAISASCPVDITFSNREFHLGDIEVIPTPGHTDGSTCFMCKSSHGRSYLFTGDTIFPDHDSWGTYVATKNKNTLQKSLIVLRSLEPDVVISSASNGRLPFREMASGEWQKTIDHVIQNLK